MWNIAADANGNPKLPGTNSCGGAGCRPLVTVNGDGSYILNQECNIASLFFYTISDFYLIVYSMAQASKAIIPIDPAGPFGQRIGVSVGGPLNWALRVGVYVTSRVSSSDWSQFSIVVMNCTLFTLIGMGINIFVKGPTGQILRQSLLLSNSEECRRVMARV